MNSSFATVVCRACVRACFVAGRRFVAYVPYLPAQSYFARYSEFNNCCRAALKLTKWQVYKLLISPCTYPTWHYALIHSILLLFLVLLFCTDLVPCHIKLHKVKQ